MIDAVEAHRNRPRQPSFCWASAVTFVGSGAKGANALHTVNAFKQTVPRSPASTREPRLADSPVRGIAYGIALSAMLWSAGALFFL